MRLQLMPCLQLLLLLMTGDVQAFWNMPLNTVVNPMGHRLYYVGETLTLFCHKASDIVGDVFFKMGNEDIPSQFVRKLNNTWAVMEKLVTSQDFPETVYQCTDNDTAPWVATLRLYHDYPPRTATDLSVTWQEKRRVLMDWAFGNVTYMNSAPGVVEVTAEWSPDDSSDKVWQECSVSDNSCEVSYDNQTSSAFFVRVNITIVKRDDRVSTIFPGIHLQDHAKPGPVQFTVKTLNPTSAKLTVHTDEKLNYTVAYTAVGDRQNHDDMMVTGLTTEKMFEIQDLHPAYTYRFEVRARYEDGYLSEPATAEQTLQMPESAPSSAPGVLPSAYFVDDSKCGQKDPVTDVYVYLQEVNFEDQNGRILSYTAEVNGETFTQSTFNGTHTLRLDSLLCGDSFDVIVYASNSVGRSPSASLSVPSRRQDIQKTGENLKLKMRVTNEGKVTAEWSPQALQDSPHLSVYLYYCSPDSANRYLCQDAIKYMQVSPEEGQHQLTEATPVMKLGVAVQSAVGLTSGIIFTDCVYNPESGPGDPPTNVRAEAQTDSIIVRWAGRQCDSINRVLILAYQIEVCTAEDSPRCKNYSTTGDNNSYEVEDVEKDVQYTVRVRAIMPRSHTAFSSPWTVSVATPPESGLSAGAVIGVCIGVLIVLIIIGCLLYCCCRDCVRERKYKFDDHFIIEPPPRTLNGGHQAGDLHANSSLSNGVTNMAFSSSNNNKNGWLTGPSPPADGGDSTVTTEDNSGGMSADRTRPDHYTAVARASTTSASSVHNNSITAPAAPTNIAVVPDTGEVQSESVIGHVLHVAAISPPPVVAGREGFFAMDGDAAYVGRGDKEEQNSSLPQMESLPSGYIKLTADQNSSLSSQNEREDARPPDGPPPAYGDAVQRVQASAPDLDDDLGEDHTPVKTLDSPTAGFPHPVDYSKGVVSYMKISTPDEDKVEVFLPQQTGVKGYCAHPSMTNTSSINRDEGPDQNVQPTTAVEENRGAASEDGQADVKPEGKPEQAGDASSAVSAALEAARDMDFSRDPPPGNHQGEETNKPTGAAGSSGYLPHQNTSQSIPPVEPYVQVTSENISNTSGVPASEEDSKPPLPSASQGSSAFSPPEAHVNPGYHPQVPPSTFSPPEAHLNPGYHPQVPPYTFSPPEAHLNPGYHPQVPPYTFSPPEAHLNPGYHPQVPPSTFSPPEVHLNPGYHPQVPPSTFSPPEAHLNPGYQPQVQVPHPALSEDEEESQPLDEEESRPLVPDSCQGSHPLSKPPAGHSAVYQPHPHVRGGSQSLLPQAGLSSGYLAHAQVQDESQSQVPYPSQDCYIPSPTEAGLNSGYRSHPHLPSGVLPVDGEESQSSVSDENSVQSSDSALPQLEAQNSSGYLPHPPVQDRSVVSPVPPVGHNTEYLPHPVSPLDAPGSKEVSLPLEADSGHSAPLPQPEASHSSEYLPRPPVQDRSQSSLPEVGHSTGYLPHPVSSLASPDGAGESQPSLPDLGQDLNTPPSLPQDRCSGEYLPHSPVQDEVQPSLPDVGHNSGYLPDSSLVTSGPEEESRPPWPDPGQNPSAPLSLPQDGRHGYVPHPHLQDGSQTSVPDSSQDSYSPPSLVEVGRNAGYHPHPHVPPLTVQGRAPPSPGLISGDGGGEKHDGHVPAFQRTDSGYASPPYQDGFTPGW